MASLIIYGLMALAALAAIAGAWNQLGHHFTDPVVAEYTAKLKSANDRATDAEAANVSLRASVEKVKGEVAACNLATAGFEQQATDAAKRATDAIAAKAAAWKAAQLALDGLRTKAAGPPTTGDACEQARVTLSDLSRDVRHILGLDVQVIGPTRIGPTK